VRVLFLNPVARLGGAEQSLVDLLTCLAGHVELGLLTFEDGPLVQIARGLGVRTSTLLLPESLMRLGDFGESGALTPLLKFMTRSSPGKLAGLVRRFRAAVSEFAPDIVHSNGIKTHLLSGAAVSGKSKLVWHVRDFLGNRRLVRRVIPALAGRVSAALAISGAVERDLRALLPTVPVAVVYNAVDLERFRPRSSEGSFLDELSGLPPAEEGVVRIGLVATYARWKGHRLFLEAAADASKRSPVPLRFYVIGGPIYFGAASQITEEDLRAWINEFGLGGRVGVVPFLEAPERAFNSLDIAVNANIAPEPFGRTVVEAMASGIPVVSGSNVGALEDLPAPSLEKLPVLSAETLSAALVSLAANPGRRRELSRLGLEAARRYSRPRLSERVLTLYRCLGARN
jgi:glycosyltransferase involved in cell wall biosynthesis